METLQYLVAGIAIGSIFLTIGKLATDYKKILSAKILIVAMVCVISFILSEIIVEPPSLLFILQIFGASIPALFWLFAVSFFSTNEEPINLGYKHYIVFVLSVLLSIVLCSYLNNGPSPERDAVIYINFTFKTVLVAFGLAAVLRNWAVDLVECRRRCRAGIIGAAGVVVIFVMMTEVIFDGQATPDIVILFTFSIITAMSLTTGYWMLISSPEGFLEATEQASLPEKVDIARQTTPDLIDIQWLEKLHSCMEHDFYYRENELTIRILAQHLAIPEHHLRRLINRHLGYRNFNDYLNRFRIKEASERLTDPANSRLPITTIALESGYISLTTFNKAFKEINEMTPSEFRKTVTHFE